MSHEPTSFPCERTDSDGNAIKIYEDGSAVFASGKTAIPEVIEPNHHRYGNVAPLHVLSMVDELQKTGQHIYS